MKDKLPDKMVIDELKKIELIVYQIAVHLYNNPETGFSEYKAVKYLTAILEKRGFNLTFRLAGLETAFKAEKKGRPGGPTIALVAEYDALPILGHACGHHLIAAGVVGAALALVPIIDHLKGNVVVIGTPAEESGGGKIILLNNGAWQGIDMAISFHPAGVTLVEPRTKASYVIHLSIDKNQANYGSVYEIYNTIVKNLSCEPVNLHCQIIEGAVSSSLSPDKLRAILRFSSENDSILEATILKMKDKIQKLNERLRYKIFLSTVLKYEQLVSSRYMADLFKKRLKQIGLPESDKNQPLGASDLGNISQHIPCLCPLISLPESNLQLHTSNFARAAHPDIAKDTLFKATEVLALTVLDLLMEK